jgi:hypothetical protein
MDELFYETARTPEEFIEFLKERNERAVEEFFFQ